MTIKVSRSQPKIGVLVIELKENITIKVQDYNPILDSLNHIQRRIKGQFGV